MEGTGPRGNGTHFGWVWYAGRATSDSSLDVWSMINNEGLFDESFWFFMMIIERDTPI